MDIGAIVFRQRERRLELARQVGLAVDRLDRVIARGRHQGTARREAGSRFFRRRARFPSRPTSAVRSATPSAGVGVQFVANRVEQRGRAAEHVAFDVAARRQR